MPWRESATTPPLRNPRARLRRRRRKENNLPDEQKTIQIKLRADPKGRIGRLQLGNQTLQGFDALKRDLTAILNDPKAPFDRANVQLDPRLRYSEIVRVAKLLGNPIMTSIHFTLAEPPGRR